MVISEMSKIVENEKISGASIFGSVENGSANERSDFDLIVITNDNYVIGEIRNVFDYIFLRTRVRVEPILIPEELARRVLHTIDQSLFVHLERSFMNDNVIGINPLEFLAPFDRHLCLVHTDYLLQKLRRLREGTFASSLADKYKVLQRALEAPINTGRRTLQAMYELGVLNSPLLDDGKNQVKKYYRETFAKTFLEYGFALLCEQDGRYTELLQEALQNHIDQNEYDEQVNDMVETCIPQALTWVSEVLTEYKSTLEGSKFTVEGIPSLRGRER